VSPGTDDGMRRSAKARSVPGRPSWRSKVVQLTDYLRRELEAARLASPLPGTRRWSQQLGVSRRTLGESIRELQREGWLTVQRRGVQVNPARALRRGARPGGLRLVRLLLFGAYGRTIHGYFETISLLHEHLRVRGLELRWEICPPARLREIVRQPTPPSEFLLLVSVPPVYQRLFAAAGKPAMVLGGVGAGISLPFVDVDQRGAVRHATFRLLQRGCREVVLLHINVAAAGIASAREAFDAACAEWPRQPVAARQISTALDPASLRAALRRLVAGRRSRTGIIVVAPIPVGLVVTALWYFGVAVPAEAEVVALFQSPEAVKLLPAPAHYPQPVRQIARLLTDAAVHYFDTGRVPPVAKTLPAELAADE